MFNENQKEDEEDDVSDIQVPMTALKIDSKDPLEMTLTKTSLGTLQNLGQVIHSKCDISFSFVFYISLFLSSPTVFHHEIGPTKAKPVTLLIYLPSSLLHH